MSSWELSAVSLDVCGPGGRPLSVALGAAAQGDRVQELPVTWLGSRIGTLRCSGPSLADELSSVGDVVALRVSAGSEPFPTAARSEGHA
jgi:hypothetical protein